MTWTQEQPVLMPLEALLQWQLNRHYETNQEIGKQNYAYADPVADAHNERDHIRGWHWSFTNLTAEVFNTSLNENIEIPLSDDYRLLYDLLPGGEQFDVLLLAGIFEQALKQALDERS